MVFNLNFSVDLCKDLYSFLHTTCSHTWVLFKHMWREQLWLPCQQSLMTYGMWQNPTSSNTEEVTFFTIIFCKIPSSKRLTSSVNIYYNIKVTLISVEQFFLKLVIWFIQNKNYKILKNMHKQDLVLSVKLQLKYNLRF